MQRFHGLGMWLVLSTIWTAFPCTCFSFNIRPGGFLPYPFFGWSIVLLYTGLCLHWIAPHKICCFLLYFMAHLCHVRTLPGTSTKTPQRTLLLPFTIHTQWMCRICCLLLTYVPHLFASPSFDTQRVRRHWSTFETEFWTLLLLQLNLDVSYTDKNATILSFPLTLLFSVYTFLSYLPLLCLPPWNF